jgi:hypothetical protein
MGRTIRRQQNQREAMPQTHWQLGACHSWRILLASFYELVKVLKLLVQLGAAQPKVLGLESGVADLRFRNNH